MLFRRKRRVPRTRGLLWAVALGNCPAQGHTGPEFGFCSPTGTSQTGSPPSPSISRKVLGRRKIIPSSPLKNHSAKFATPCKRFSNLLRRSSFLCLSSANFALPYPVTRRYVNSHFRHTKQRTRPALGPGSNITSIFGGNGQPRQVLLIFVRYRLLNGKDGVQEHSVFYFAVSSLDGGLFRVDESLLPPTGEHTSAPCWGSSLCIAPIRLKLGQH